MSTIIAGRFAELARAEHAVAALAESGFRPESITHFFVTPQGQHDTHGQAHDLDDSAGAQTAGTGAVAGAGAGGGVGAVVGLAATPLFGPAAPIAGAAVGAYIGSLHGTLNQLDPGEQVATAGDTASPKYEPAPRKSGFLVAVEASDAEEARAIETLEQNGASDIERAEGAIIGGKWDDFDPAAPPARIALRHRSGGAADPDLPRLLTPGP
jgi:hypothetical protein